MITDEDRHPPMDPWARIRELEQRLDEAHQLLDAIRSGQVDAFVLAEGGQLRVRPLMGPEEAMAGSILEQTSHPVLVCDAAGVIVRATAAARQLVGADLVQKEFVHALPMHLLAERARRCDARSHPRPVLCLPAVQHGKSYRALRACLHLGDGTTRDLLVNAGPLRRRHGEVAGSVVELVDITAQLSVERELAEYRDRLEQLVGERTRELREANLKLTAEAEERLRAQVALLQLASAVDASDDAIVVHDLEGRVLAWTAGATRMFGRTKDEMVGAHLEVLVPVDRSQELADHLAAVRAGHSLRDVETLRLADPHRSVEVSVTMSPLRDGAGSVTGGIKVYRDISTRNALEEQLRQSQKMEAIGRLAGGVAHDFNNILTIINGYCELALDSIVDRDTSNLIEHVRKSSKRASLLTRQLLAFSRKQVLQATVVDAGEVVGEMRHMLTRLIGEDIGLTLEVERGLWHTRVDVSQLQQVMLNLVVNARDAMPQGGSLRIELSNATLEGSGPCRHEGDHVSIAVTDTGHGMDDTTRARIFEPFFTTKGPDKGTGLGLATVFGIVKQSEGHIEVRSKPGAGSTFQVYLRRVLDATPTAEEPPASTRVSMSTVTILLAEDDHQLRRLTRIMLTNLGHTVLEASDGAEAIRICAGFKEHIQLLVTDVVMPDMNGREVSEAIKALQPDVHVLFLSGYTDDEVLRRGVVQASANFLQKPFSAADLAERVSRILSGRGCRE